MGTWKREACASTPTSPFAPKGKQSSAPASKSKTSTLFPSWKWPSSQKSPAKSPSTSTTPPHRSPLELIPPGTYRWDQESRQTVLMRAKESADDYRYFPEPDLVPIVLSEELLDALRRSLPELPHERFRRYVFDLGLTEYAASTLINEKILSDYF